MPRDNGVCRTDSGFARLSRSPYQQVKEVRLREDSQGNIEGVEYLAGLSGYETEDGNDLRPRKSSTTSPLSRSFKHRYSNGGSRRTSEASKHRSSVDRRRPHLSNHISASGATRLCPSPGKRPSAQFTLSSPEMSCKEESTDDDVPKLSLTEAYVPRPRSSIRKSPLLNKDLLRFVNDAGGESASDLEPMIFAISMGEESDWEYGGSGRTPPKSTSTQITQPVQRENREIIARPNEEELHPMVGVNASGVKQGQSAVCCREAHTSTEGCYYQLDGDKDECSRGLEVDGAV